MLTYFEQIIFKTLLFLGVLSATLTQSTSTSPLIPSSQNTDKSREIIEKTIPPSPKKVSIPVSTTIKSEAPLITEKNIPQPPIETKTVSLQDLNNKTRKALVNILCVSKSAGPLEPSSGSGVLIDKRGVILTNAHIAQYILLKNFGEKNFIDCVIRQGSPAEPLYKANLLYISQKWVEEHAKDIISHDPTGTGENDFALIQIGDPVSSSIEKPREFPFLPINNNDRTIRAGDTTITAGYPAEFLGGVSIQRDLFPASSVTTIGQLFNFHGEDVIDVFSVGASIISQKGSSGGPVVNTQGELTGIVVTETEGKKTSDRDLRALSTTHINREMKKEIGNTLNEFLLSNLESARNNFEYKFAQKLRKLLEEAILNQNS